MTTTKTESCFFLRFYGQKKADVEACVEALRAEFPQITGFVYNKPEMSMNATLKPSQEIDLLFACDEDRDFVRQSKAMSEIYSAHSLSPALRARYGMPKITLRAPKDAAFSHA